MLGQILSTLLGDNDLPVEAAPRAVYLAEERKQLDTAEADAVERAQQAMAAARREAADKRAALETREAALALKLADTLAKEAQSTLVPLFAAFNESPTRAVALSVADAVRALDDRSRVQLAVPLSPWTVSIAAATAIVKVRPFSLSAFCYEDSLKHGTLSAATRLTAASVEGASAAVAYALLLDLEAALEERVRLDGGRPVDEDDAARWRLAQESWRNTDRVTRVRAHVDLHAESRARRFASPTDTSALVA